MSLIKHPTTIRNRKKTHNTTSIIYIYAALKSFWIEQLCFCFVWHTRTLVRIAFSFFHCFIVRSSLSSSSSSASLFAHFLRATTHLPTSSFTQFIVHSWIYTHTHSLCVAYKIIFLRSKARKLKHKWSVIVHNLFIHGAEKEREIIISEHTYTPCTNTLSLSFKNVIFRPDGIDILHKSIYVLLFKPKV